MVSVYNVTYCMYIHTVVYYCEHFISKIVMLVYQYIMLKIVKAKGLKQTVIVVHCIRSIPITGCKIIIFKFSFFISQFLTFKNVF